MTDTSAPWVTEDHALKLVEQALGGSRLDADFALSDAISAGRVRRVGDKINQLELREYFSIAGPSTTTARVGRPAKWEWERMLRALVVRMAKDPDGLPAGVGAQAELEALIKDWFVANYGDHPAESEIRKQASLIFQEQAEK